MYSREFAARRRRASARRTVAIHAAANLGRSGLTMAVRSSWRSLICMLALALAAGGAPPPLPGTQGAVRVPFVMPIDGKASVGLYTQGGQLVRILAQGLALRQGEHVALWDGLDLWGNLLPAGTELQVKIITGPGLRVVYEFCVGRGDTPPEHPGWLTKPFPTPTPTPLPPPHSIIDNRQSTIKNRHSTIPTRQSTIGNRKSTIGNRKSKIENRKSKIENRKSKILPSAPAAGWATTPAPGRRRPSATRSSLAARWPNTGTT